MVNSFLNCLKQKGKSNKTVTAYKLSLGRFNTWFQKAEGVRTGEGGHPARRKGCDIYTQNFNNSNDSDTQRSSSGTYRKFSDTHRSPSVFPRSLTDIHCTPNDASDSAQHLSFHEVTQIDIADFKRYAAKHYQPSTVRVTLTHLRVFYNYLVEQGEVPDNPVQHVDALKTVKLAPKWLNRNEQNALIRAVRKHGTLRELTLVTLMLHTGLRVQEVVDLRLVDLQLGERKGKLTVAKGKHNRRREVPLNVDARRLLAQYIEEEQPAEYLFTGRYGGKITTRALQHIIEKYRQLTGIDALTAHSLRHTFCHELVSRKIPLDVVARLAGHIKNDGTPNIQQTLVYTQPNEDDLQRAVDELSWR